MNYVHNRLPLEKQLGTKLYDTLEGDILNDIMAEGKVEGMAFDYHRILQEHSFKVSAQLAPGLYGIFQEVVETLEFTEPLGFYINDSPELNAFAVASLTPDKPHIINVNSGLIKKLTDRKFRPEVGHETVRRISSNEIAFMFEAGTQMMGMSRKEIAQLIAENIQQGFNPDLFGGE